MDKKARGTTEVLCKKIWSLHKRGFRPTEIAKVLDTSRSTVNRTVAIFTAYEYKDLNMMGNYKNSSLKIEAFAKEFFGIDLSDKHEESDEQIEIKDVTSENASDGALDNTATYLINLINEIRHTNLMLERICDAMNV